MRDVVGKRNNTCPDDIVADCVGGMAAALFALLAVAALGRQANAETLNEALVDAYLINPTLNAERARLRAIDEQVESSRQIWPAPQHLLEAAMRQS